MEMMITARVKLPKRRGARVVVVLLLKQAETERPPAPLWYTQQQAQQRRLQLLGIASYAFGIC